MYNRALEPKDYTLGIVDNDPLVLELLTHYFVASHAPLHNESLTRWYQQSAQVNPLSPRELQALDYYSQGKTTLFIAHKMNVGESSVKTFVKRACKKLNVRSRTEAIVSCVRNNWI
ncbi:DNA-binding response regulator [Bifidobacterium pseudolongum subsp. globosum]|uniref:DNA-binding response regulator n=2 Tax=Bifidobacterium pseudolongum TaxID=1694 RepID=A0A4Q4ZZW2_9BIFI|nr:DNA-binding response regulator [Bifidobacterium pseudolongum subsp. globosum]